MKKIELKILGLSYSSGKLDSCVLILKELMGERKLPIVVKLRDSNMIINGIENTKSDRPNFGTILKDTIDIFGGDVREVFIDSITEGLINSKIIIGNHMDDYEVSSNITDSMGIASLFRCPITASSEVMDVYGISMSDDGSMSQEDDAYNKRERNTFFSVDDMSGLLEKAIADQDFELAARLRDRINKSGTKD